MERRVLPVLLALALTFFLPPSASAELERDDASAGLPQETDSFTSVQARDSDRDGLDEIYMGGSGFRDGTILTEGIRAYEFDPGMNSWYPFGSGLPAEGSGVYYGDLGLGDVNGDGEMDIAAPIPSRWYAIDETGVDIYAGDGNGNFALLHRIPLEDGNPGSSNQVVIADLDADGSNDVAVSTYTGVNVFYGDGTGTNWEEKSPPHVKSTEISGIGIGDLDGDGLLDIVGTPYQRSTDVEMYVQGARRTWRDVPFKEVQAGYGTKVQDVDGDGNSDVVYGTHSEGIKVWLGQGEVSLTEFPCTEASAGLPDGGPWDQVELGDVNGDGLPDIVAACSSEGYAHLYLNQLPTGWTEVFTGDQGLFVGGDAYGANFGDWNGDGALDIVACGWEDGANAWLIAGSSGGNRPPTADAGEDRTASVGEDVELDGSGSHDPDGTISAWEWSCTSDPGIEIADADKARASFVPDSAGAVRIALRVKDDQGAWSGRDEIVVTVIDPLVNQRPVADAGDPMTGNVGDTILLDGTGSKDPDGTISAYEWTPVGRDIVVQDADSAEASFVPAEEGDYTFSLVVVDDDGARSDPDTVTAHVSLQMFYPRIGPFLYRSGTPVEGAVVSLSLDQAEHSAVTDATGYASFENGVPPGSYECSLSKGGEALIDSFRITIRDTGSISVDGGSIPRAPDPEEGARTFMVVGIAVGVVMLIGLSVILFLLVRKRPEEVVPVVMPAERKCDRCGGGLVYNRDFQRYRCQVCGEYK